MTMQTAARSASPDCWSHAAALYLVSIDSLKNRYRFYRMRHQRTLWSEDVLVQTWGRQGTDGRTRVQFLEGREHVQTEMAKLLRRRLQPRLPGAVHSLVARALPLASVTEPESASWPYPYTASAGDVLLNAGSGNIRTLLDEVSAREGGRYPRTAAAHRGPASAAHLHTAGHG